MSTYFVGDRECTTGRTSYRIDDANPLPGFYRARVENDADPLKLGRVQIRIPQLHGIPGDSDCLQTEKLPWAMPGLFDSAAHDMGEFNPPYPGAVVWVATEAGNPNLFIYFGGCFGKTPEGKAMGSDGTKFGVWRSPAGDETISETFKSRKGFSPRKRVIFKNSIGNVIMSDETKGKESFTIMDRLGAIFKMISPAEKGDTKDSRSTLRRGDHSIVSNTPLPYFGKAIIVIKDVSKQVFRFVSKKAGEKIELFSRSVDKPKNYSGLDIQGANAVINIISYDESGNKSFITLNGKSGTIELGTCSGDTKNGSIILSNGSLSFDGKPLTTQTWTHVDGFTGATYTLNYVKWTGGPLPTSNPNWTDSEPEKDYE